MIIEINDLLLGFIAGIAASVGVVIGLHMVTRNVVTNKMEAWK